MMIIDTCKRRTTHLAIADGLYFVFLLNKPIRHVVMACTLS